MTNGSVNINFSLNDGSNTGCYPHKVYFGVARGGVDQSSGWLSTLINNPSESVSWVKTFTEDGYYTYRGRTANKQNTMGPYDTNPYFFCIDTQPPTIPSGDSLSCTYDQTTQKFNVNYRWQISTENGCAGLHAFPYWAQLSLYSDFHIAVNSNNWINQTVTQASGIADGATIYAHVRSRDKIDNQSGWTTTKLIPVNCKNCTGCPIPTNTPTPRPTNTPTPIPTNTPTPIPTNTPTPIPTNTPTPIPTNTPTPIPTNTPTPITATPTPVLVPPICNGIASSYNASDNTIRTIFHFEGNNTSNATLYPYCAYSENTAAASWFGMTPITANVNPAKVGRPYPGQTTGDYICKSSPLAVGVTYKTMAQANIFYDLNNSLGHNTGEPILSTACSSQPLVSAPTPTTIPTPTLSFPLCSNFTASQSNGIITAGYNFQGMNSPDSLLNTSCYYAPIGTSSWLGMTGSSYRAGNASGTQTCSSALVSPGVYKVVASVYVFYDTNSNGVFDSAQELRKICSGNPDAPEPKNPDCNTCLAEVTIPSSSTPTPTLPLTPIVTSPVTSPTPVCVGGSPSCPKKCLGDENCDDVIDLTDKNHWKDQYSTPGLKTADFNGDGIIDLRDYGLWRDNTVY